MITKARIKWLLNRWKWLFILFVAVFGSFCTFVGLIVLIILKIRG